MSKKTGSGPAGLSATGISGLDTILCGGLPSDRLYLVQGEPGTGKTTLALQFLLEGARRGEKCLYITFSETQSELRSVSDSHGWDISALEFFDLSTIEHQLQPESQNTVFHSSEVEMNQTVRLILDEIDRVQPRRVVFDSVTELRMLAETSFKYRRQILALKQIFSKRSCTVLFLDDLTAAPRDLQVQSIVHGVIQLQKLHPEFGDERRRLSIVKLRGVQFIGGNHDYVIRKGGLKVFPRMIASEHMGNFPRETPISSGIPHLDSLLGGGLDPGTSSLFMGPAGTGKSTLAIQFAYAAAERGEKAAIFAFEESLQTMLARTAALGMDLQKHIKSGLLHIQKVDPAELSPGEFADLIRTRVLREDLKVISIDSLNGYLHAMPQEEFLTLQLHELLAFLGNQGVVTLLVLAQQGMMGMMQTPVDLTYLADTVIVTRYFEAVGSVRKAVSVIKKRAGLHETTIRELNIQKGGIVVGEPLTNFQGVLTGVPALIGKDLKGGLLNAELE
jgi:circadian clock protein KaiC